MSKYKEDCPTLFISRGSKKSCYSFVETIYKMKLNTPVTKYADTLTYYYPKWHIMPL